MNELLPIFVALSIIVAYFSSYIGEKWLPNVHGAAKEWIMVGISVINGLLAALASEKIGILELEWTNAESIMLSIGNILTCTTIIWTETYAWFKAKVRPDAEKSIQRKMIEEL
jgi:uncharacterized paraquat-inducible protein A